MLLHGFINLSRKWEISVSCIFSFITKGIDVVGYNGNINLWMGIFSEQFHFEVLCANMSIGNHCSFKSWCFVLFCIIFINWLLNRQFVRISDRTKCDIESRKPWTVLTENSCKNMVESITHFSNLLCRSRI